MDTAATLLPLLVAAAGGLCSLLFFVAVAGGLFVYLKRSGALSGGLPGGRPAVDVDGIQRMYTDRLGYESQPTGDPAQTHMVRVFDGLEVHLRSDTRDGAMGVNVEYGWSTPAPARFTVHIVEQTVADPSKRMLRDGAMNRHRDFSPRWPTAFPTGSAALDARFRVFAPDARSAAAAVALEAELLACAHVDLTATPEGSTLSDPFQQGLLARMGGPMGMAGITTPRGIEVQVQLHEDAARLLKACT